jgi:hypothetical protein
MRCKKERFFVMRVPKACHGGELMTKGSRLNRGPSTFLNDSTHNDTDLLVNLQSLNFFEQDEQTSIHHKDELPVMPKVWSRRKEGSCLAKLDGSLREAKTDGWLAFLGREPNSR